LTKPWIQSYIDYVSPASQSPDEFHWWSAITILAASLKRHVWIDRGNWKLFPNLYTVLVGRPATGKGTSINPAMALLKEANTANVLSDRLTIEYVLERLSTGFPSTNIIGGQITTAVDSSAIIFASELSVFLRKSTDALADLAQLWDCLPDFDYGTRQRGMYTIKNPCVSLLGGSPPSWLAKSVPNDAVGGGFTRRVNFVYTKSDPVLPTWEPLHPSLNGTGKRRDELIDDLRLIHGLRGQFKATPEFIKTFDAYTQATKFDDFDDESKTGFKASKWVNTTKLCMILSISRDDSFLLRKEDLNLAIKMTDKVEEDLGLVFRTVGESSDTVAAGHILNFVERRGKATFSHILQATWRHSSKDDTIRILSTLVGAGLLGEGMSGTSTIYTFKKIP